MSDLYEDLTRGYRESVARQDHRMAAVIIVSIVDMAMQPGSGRDPVAIITKMITPSEIVTLDDVSQEEPLEEDTFTLGDLAGMDFDN